MELVQIIAKLAPALAESAVPVQRDSAAVPSGTAGRVPDSVHLVRRPQPLPPPLLLLQPLRQHLQALSAPMRARFVIQVLAVVSGVGVVLGRHFVGERSAEQGGEGWRFDSNIFNISGFGGIT